jgi:hypothetical protein
MLSVIKFREAASRKDKPALREASRQSHKLLDVYLGRGEGRRNETRTC